MSERRCGCGCGKNLPATARANRLYLDGHRDRAYRKRLRREAEALGLPGRLTVATLSAPSTTRRASADAPRRRNRPQKRRAGVTVYLPSVEMAQAVYDALIPGRHSDLSNEAGGIVGAAIERRRARG